MDSTGEVIEVNNKSVLVAFGSMITTVEHSKLELAENISIPDKKSKSITGTYDERKLNFKSQLDVRGMRGEEAITKVQDFIDDATVLAVKQVRILHGKGNGILRQMIRDYLQAFNFIASVKDDHPDRGGAGITVVELDI